MVIPFPAAAQHREVATTIVFTDGPTVDEAGNVYFTDVIKAKSLKFIPIPEDLIANNTFGGPDMKTLYVSAGKTCIRYGRRSLGFRAGRANALSFLSWVEE